MNVSTMRLWLLRPVVGAHGLPASKEWEDWSDCTFGFVVRAETEEQARALVAERGHAQTLPFGAAQALGWGSEVRSWIDVFHDADEAAFVPTPSNCVWLDPARATCVELSAEGPAEVVLADHRPA